MIVRATVRFGQILEALELESIAGVDRNAEEWVLLEEVDVEECDLDIDCEICGGVDPEPEEAVNPSLISDFIAAIKAGDLPTAQALVGRVFDAPMDIAVVDGAIRKCAI